MAYRLIIPFVLVLLPLQLGAIQRYQANIEQSRWELASSPLRCELRHPIPRYGQGVFVHSAGGELAFKIHVFDPPVANSVASMLSVAPFWKPGENRELAQVSLEKGKMPVYISRQLALRMLYELDAGRFPTLHYKDWADQTEDVYVALSSANFHQVLPLFRQCVDGLVPHGLADLKDTSVMFAFGRAELSLVARQKLDEMALFAAHEPSLRFFIEGHTDSRGTRRFNQRLANRRTRVVVDYLVAKGVRPGQIEVKAYGEKQPVASNTTEHGRAKNRRVTVSVVR
jgi:outer membrane protein OmpA-like peptidoglycan-associated protein